MDTDDTIEYANDEGDDSLAAKLKKLKDELRRSEALQKEYLDGWQRAKADFINYKKDEARRFQDAARMGIHDMASDILVVLDSFQMARQYDMPSRVADGVFMIQGQLEDVLQKHGIAAIGVQPGDPFDPQIHESMGEVESWHLKGTIAEEVQRGYAMDGRILRPARVRLSKEKSPSAESRGDD